ncbi:hypothetical protein BC936DRAFT_147446 [Jimgerdemannia flammicorona]|uniref:Uncharacterized protein n=1 Tax=Jimgerdemannia flammicorona TaxID=994334 RepID=A0A433D598_9FUNG|nr:hypothetical protein BC936DRAFT_147446 [Jimgerdemannia flammicorona]
MFDIGDHVQYKLANSQSTGVIIDILKTLSRKRTSRSSKMSGWEMLCPAYHRRQKVYLLESTLRCN